MSNKLKSVLHFIKWIPLGFSLFVSVNVLISFFSDQPIVLPIWLMLGLLVAFAGVQYAAEKLDLHANATPRARFLNNLAWSGGIVLAFGWELLVVLS